MNLAGPKAWNFAAQVLKMICAKASLNRRQLVLSDWDLLGISGRSSLSEGYGYGWGWG